MEGILDCLEESGINVISPDKNVPKRKSSIFNRRSSFVGDSENIQCVGSSSESDFDLGKYTTSLKKEVLDWETMYKERKKTRTLAKKLYRSNVLSEEDVFNLFNEEDKKFLQSCPDYNRIGAEAIEALQKFHISFQKRIDVEKSSQLIINSTQHSERELRKTIVELSGIIL